MDVHNYDPITGEYLSSHPATLDPRGGQPLVPAHATTEPVPADVAGFARVWNGAKWTSVVDRRGTTFWLPDGQEVRITGLGVDVPEGSSLEPLPPSFEAQRDGAIATAVDLASEYRSAVLAVRPERATGWLLKALFAAVAQMDAGAPEVNPARAALAALADQGFQIEADITGEQPDELQESAVRSASALFLALQLVEGMERLATRLIPATQDQAALDAVVEQLRALEVSAAEQLAQITGGTHA